MKEVLSVSAEGILFHFSVEVLGDAFEVGAVADVGAGVGHEGGVARGLLLTTTCYF